ncbi:Hypothetical predicted protein [Mytilus galloprovincialis]|uniref:Endonuclease/exonuclease/phosphatase domain-containing protein n=1 Tax=Mytilus galloprovincialis TaxID=29158 RepID=A0A8B6BSW9_MYTGA|nr:Hypothetical predicted protein [Mytilus galloprovincialis]
MQCLTCILVFSVLHWTTYEATYVRSAGIGSAASGTNSAVIFPVIKQTVTTTRPVTEGTHINYMQNKFSLGSSATGKNSVNFIDFGNGNIRPDSKDGDCRYFYNEKVTSTNFVTFNTGLGTSVSFYEQRKNLIIEALLQSEADVLCLNELWYVEDLIQIQKALQGNFPHSFSIIHDDAAIIMDKHTLAQPPCASVIFRTTMKCFMTHCNTSRNLTEKAGCFLVTCNASRLLSVECLTCVIISGTHTVNVIEKCANTSPSRQFNAFNLPGLALFSKLPLAHRNRQNLIPNMKRLVSRWVLSAEVEKVGRIGCTHFTALMPFSYVDPVVPPLFSSFEEENLNNTLQILDYFKFAKQYILMGDFNQSPLRANVTPTFSDNYNVLRANGLSDPYVDNGGLPTFGRGNPLSIFQDRNLILDHIFHKGFDYISSKRVFDKFIGVKGQSIPLSDHFGVSVTLQLKNCTALP